MNHFFLAIGHFFQNAQIWISKEFEAVFGSKAATAFALGAEALLKTAAGKIVVGVVQAAATLEISGPAKAALALSQLPALIEGAGLTASTSMLNLLIETAVQKVKGAFGTDIPLAAPVPDPGVKWIAPAAAAPAPAATPTPAPAPAAAPTPAPAPAAAPVLPSE